jgi:hypothetical protein
VVRYFTDSDKGSIVKTADWIGFVMALLGAVLILAGAALIFVNAQRQLRTAGSAYGDDATGTTPANDRGLVRRIFSAVRTTPDADRLIAWGLVLLFIGALASGALKFGFALELGTFNTSVAR